ncbi:MAG: folate-binding protein [Gammaproteobacteria bacterium]|nr:folate-binding protein [Gammaproteobacteria bacterium]
MNRQQWRQFLTQQGANWQGDQALFTETDAQLRLVDLTPQGAITVTGPDSQKFLQGQLSCDLITLADEQATLGSHCNPKGRMISAFYALKLAADEFVLSMPQDLVPLALAALKKYAVFFKTELTDSGAKADDSAMHCLGLVGPGAGDCAVNMLVLDKLLPGTVVPFDCNGQRALAHMISDCQVALWVPALQLADLWQRLAGKPAIPASYHHWQQQLIAAGIPQLQTATSESYIPQMLNLHLLNGVSFKKGCYTGQEVVARMQFRGATKRRMFRVQVSGASVPSAGQTIFTSGSSQSIGSVVQACVVAEGVQMLSVLTKSKVAAGEALLLEDGRQLELLTLPYDGDADPLE